MLDKIMDLVGGDALNEITSKAGISMDQAKEMLPLAGESLQEGLMSEVTGGNTDGIMGMFQSALGGGGGGLMSNGIFGSIKAMFMKKIMTKMGLPESVAGLAAGSGLSSMIGGLAGKMSDDGDNDGIDMSNIMNVLGMGGGAAGLLGGLMGGGDSAGGGLMDSLKDAAGGLLGGNDSEGDSKKDGGGLLGGLKDAAGGLFGK